MIRFISTHERYVNPFTDFGFKKLFGSEINKDLLISFLNALLLEEQTVVDVTYLRNERIGSGEFDRKAVFDVYCKNDRGEYFIVEMQKAKQKYFKDRSVYYSSFPIQEQGKRGEWDFELKAIYTIGILDFVFDEDKDDPNYYQHEIKLMDVTKKNVFYDKLTFIYLEMPKFKKNENELESLFDKWMFLLKNITLLTNRPVALQERVFERAFRVAEIAKFDPGELMEYEESLKNYRDLKNVIDTAVEEASEKALIKGKEEGREEGRREGILDVALSLRNMGMELEQIAAATGLSLSEIEHLL